MRQGQISFGALNALRPMVARLEARRVMDEIENNEDEKMNRDAEKPNPARVEGNDAGELPNETANPDAGHKLWLVWIPARKKPSEGGLA